ncbi:MAG: hypothetical protein KC910_31425, partial [Candidatus Eremiobacteraeota bacterium]|nr:hypothetical protein [Candidatus Eremiobacteraeota bacterium]
LIARDDEAEAGLARAGKKMLGAVLCLLGALTLGYYSQTTPSPTGDGLKMGAYGLCGVALVLVIWAVVLRLLHGRHDLDDNKLEVRNQLTRMLSVDLASKARIEARMGSPVFRLHRTQGLGQLLEAYQDEWLDLRGQLRDRTRLRLRVTCSGKQRVKFKRKRKRTSERVGAPRHSSQVRIQLKGKLPAGLRDSLPEPSGFEQSQVVDLRIDQDDLDLIVRYPHTALPDYDQLLAPLVWLYRGMQVARRLNQAQ